MTPDEAQPDPERSFSVTWLAHAPATWIGLAGVVLGVLGPFLNYVTVDLGPFGNRFGAEFEAETGYSVGSNLGVTIGDGRFALVITLVIGALVAAHLFRGAADRRIAVATVVVATVAALAAFIDVVDEADVGAVAEAAGVSVRQGVGVYVHFVGAALMLAAAILLARAARAPRS